MTPAERAANIRKRLKTSIDTPRQYKFNALAVTLVDEVLKAIERGESKQFWLTIKDELIR